jgi:hypothetical protein
MDSSKFPRRTLLQRGLLVIGGALGLVAAERRPVREVAAAPPQPEPTRGASAGTLRLYGWGWRPQAQSPLLGRGSEGDHLVGYGDLVDAATGAVVGRFCTNGFCPQTPFGHTIAATPTIEFQTLVLNDGTVFGIGAGALSGAAEQTYAIVGGTGRFASARGTYTARTASANGSRGAIEFTLTLTA